MNISITNNTISLIRNNKTWNHLTNNLQFPKTIGSKNVNNGRHSDYYIRKEIRQNDIKKILKY